MRGPASDARYDAVVVGASLAGCATAMMLARHGAKVALLERSPRDDAFKRVCTHFIQASAVPVLDRLGLTGPIADAGGVEVVADFWTRAGWVHPPSPERASVQLRREKLDPIVRRAAAETPGIDLMLGHTVDALVRDSGRVAGVQAARRGAPPRTVRGRLVVAADGRDSSVAEMAGVRTRTSEHNRFVYWAYYSGIELPWPGRSRMWLLDPDVGYAMPTDEGLTVMAFMRTKEHLAEFKRDTAGNLARHLAAMPDAPEVSDAQRESPLVGKLHQPCRRRRTSYRGMALVGDAAMASDSLWGVGCGFALQSSEWLADEVGPALAEGASLDLPLARYGLRHRVGLGGHDYTLRDYATGRPLGAFERLLFAGAVHDTKVAERMDAFGSRSIGLTRVATPGVLARAARSAASSRARQRPGQSRNSMPLSRAQYSRPRR